MKSYKPSDCNATLAQVCTDYSLEGHLKWPSLSLYLYGECSCEPSSGVMLLFLLRTEESLQKLRGSLGDDPAL